MVELVVFFFACVEPFVAAAVESVVAVVSIVGFNVEADPVTDELTSGDEPVMDEVLPEVEPLSDGFGNPVLAVLLPVTAPLAAASLSGVQSICTGLAEFSFAMPVLLSASLPACG